MPTIDHLLTTMYPSSPPAGASADSAQSPVLQSGVICGSPLPVEAGASEAPDRRTGQVVEEKVDHSEVVAGIAMALAQDDPLPLTLSRCAQAFVDHLNAALARIWTLSEQENMLELQASAGLYTNIDGTHSRVPVGAFKIGLIAEQRTPHLTNSVIDDPRLRDPKWARREGLVAFAGYPLLIGDRLLGVMAVFARQPLTDATLKALESVSSLIAVGIERHRNTARRNEAEGALQVRMAAIDACVDAVVITDCGGRVQYVNPAFTSMTGYEQHEIVGRSTSVLKSGAHDAAFYERLWSQILGGRVWHGEVINRRKDESLYPEEMTITPVRDSSGSIARFVAIKRDVTERKRVEDQLRAHERQLAEAQRLAHVGSWRRDLRTNTLQWSDEHYRILGLTPGELEPTFEGFLARMHPGDRERISGLVDEVLRGSADQYECEFRVLRPDGSTRTVHARGEIIRDPLGQALEIIGSLQDITQRRQEEAARARLAAIVEFSNDAVISETLDGTIVSWNQAAERIFGFTAEEAIGRKVSLLTPPERGQEMSAILDQIAAGHRVEHFDTVRMRKDGTRLDVSLTISPILDSNQRVVGASAIARDITERRRAEALERERKGLQEAIRAMERVLAVVGHELRTPLAGVRAMTEFLLTDGTRETAEAGVFMQSIHDEVVRMAGTINDILEVARLNSGTARWNWSSFSVAEVCADAAAGIRPLIDGQRVCLSVRVEPPDLVMNGDAAAVRRMILNLLSNAHKHTSDGRIEVVAKQISNGRTWVDFAVSDTGEGIAAEIALKLGQAFALNSGVIGDSHVRGSGLGLAICRGIVAAHGGSIRVRSTPGQGTVICARLGADLPEPVAHGPEHGISRSTL